MTEKRSGYGSEAGALAGAVADGVHGHLGSTEHREQQVRDRGAIGGAQMLAAVLTAAAADHRQRQREVIVRVAVAHVAAVQNDRANRE